MNTAVSVASLACATALTAGPALARELPAISLGEVSFPDLVSRFIRIRERWVAQKERDEAHSKIVFDAFFRDTGITRAEWHAMTYHDPRWTAAEVALDKVLHENPDDDPIDEAGASIAWNEIHDELSPLAEAMLDRTPESLADLAWQAEAVVMVGTELRESDDPDARLARRLISNIFALAGPLPMHHAILPPEAADPIFAALKAHRQANAKYAEALVAPSRTLGRHRTPKVLVGHHRKGSCQITKSSDGIIESLTWTATAEMVPTYVSSREGIERNVPETLAGDDRAKWIAERVADFEKQEKRIAKNHRRSKLGKLEAAMEREYDHERDAMWDLIWTVPTTLDGLWALLMYCQANESINELVHNDEWEDVLEWTIARAVSAFAGMPAPQPDGIVRSFLDKREQEQDERATA